MRRRTSLCSPQCRTPESTFLTACPWPSASSGAPWSSSRSICGWKRMYSSIESDHQARADTIEQLTTYTAKLESELDSVPNGAASQPHRSLNRRRAGRSGQLSKRSANVRGQPLETELERLRLELGSELQRRMQDLAQRDLELRHLQADLAVKESFITHLRQVTEDARAEHDRLRAALQAERDQVRAELQSALGHRTQELAQKDTALRHLQADLAVKEAFIADLRRGLLDLRGIANSAGLRIVNRVTGRLSRHPEPPDSSGASRSALPDHRSLEPEVTMSDVSFREWVQSQVEKEPYWFHRMELFPGFVTPGWSDPRTDKLPTSGCPRISPESASSTLDAPRASSHSKPNVVVRKKWWQSIRIQIPFAVSTFCRNALGSKATAFLCNVYDLNPRAFGTFNVVLFFGVLYHLRNPILALEKILTVCSGTMRLQTANMEIASEGDAPLARFLPPSACPAVRRITRVSTIPSSGCLTRRAPERWSNMRDFRRSRCCLHRTSA